MQARAGAPSLATPPDAGQRRGATILMLGGLVAGTALAVVAYLGIAGHFNGWWYVARPIRTDFALYYRDAQVALQYGWNHMYDLEAFRRVTQQLGIKNSDPDIVSLSPAPLLWLVAPFALVPIPLGYALWVGIQLACLVLAWWLAAGGRGPQRAGQLALAPAFIPLVFGLCLGQVIFVVMAGLAASFWLLRRGREIPAGAALGLLVLKPHIAVLVPLALLMAGRRRAFAAFAGTGGLILGVMLLTIPAETVWAYVTRLTTAGLHPKDWMVYTDLTTAAISPRALALGVQLASLVAVLGVAYLVRRDSQRDEIAMAAGLLGSLLIAPYIHYQDLTLLILAAWLYLRTAPSRWMKYLLVFGFIAANSEIFVAGGLTRLAELGWLLGMLVVALRSRTPTLQPAPAGNWLRRLDSNQQPRR